MCDKLYKNLFSWENSFKKGMPAAVSLGKLFRLYYLLTPSLCNTCCSHKEHIHIQKGKLGKWDVVDKRHRPRFFREHLPSKRDILIAPAENLEMQVVIRARACEEAGQVLQGRGPWPSLPLALKSSLSPQAQLLTGPTDTFQISHCVVINAHEGETSSTYCRWGKLMNQQVNAPADHMLKIEIFLSASPISIHGYVKACM